MWLKQSEMHGLTVLEARSPRSGCWQSWFLLRALRHTSPLASGGLLAIFGTPQLVDTSPDLSHHPLLTFSLYMCLCPDFPFFMSTPVIRSNPSDLALS